MAQQKKITPSKKINPLTNRLVNITRLDFLVKNGLLFKSNNGRYYKVKIPKIPKIKIPKIKIPKIKIPKIKIQNEEKYEKDEEKKEINNIDIEKILNNEIERNRIRKQQNREYKEIIKSVDDAETRRILKTKRYTDKMGIIKQWSTYKDYMTEKEVDEDRTIEYLNRTEHNKYDNLRELIYNTLNGINFLDHDFKLRFQIITFKEHMFRKYDAEKETKEKYYEEKETWLDLKFRAYDETKESKEKYNEEKEVWITQGVNITKKLSSYPVDAPFELLQFNIYEPSSISMELNLKDLNIYDIKKENKNMIITEIDYGEEQPTDDRGLPIKTYNINMPSRTLIEYYINKVVEHNMSMNYKLKFSFLGFHIFVQNKRMNEISEKKEKEDFNIYVKSLKAFSPSTAIQYHKMTACSTTKDRLCIYQSYYYLYVNNSTMISKVSETIKEALTHETDIIKEYIKKGQLAAFLLEKSKTTDEKYYVQFFDTDEKGFMIYKNEIIQIKELKEFINKKVFLYSKQHVAPRIVMTNEEYETVYKINLDKKKQKKSYVLHPTRLKKPKENEKKPHILGFDFETYTDDRNKAHPFNLCINSKDKDFFSNKLDTLDYKHETGENKIFYDNDPDRLINDFIKFLDIIKTPMNISKTNATEAVQYIHMYGFNNSRFDNILFFKQLTKVNPSLKYNLVDSNIKYIEYHNIKIFDLNLYYAGSLDSVCKSFNLIQEKGAFPILYPKKDNLNYSGDVPDKKYFKNNKDYLICCALNKDKIYNLKNECIKYCCMDAKLCTIIADIHIKNCKGIVEEGTTKRYIDTSTSITGASVSKNTYSQGFQKESLYESPPKIQILERLAYKGGRTEVFKKRFEKKPNDNIKDKNFFTNDNDYYKYLYTRVLKQLTNNLYYYDINSSYPYCMTKMMPYKYINTYYNINQRINKNNMTRINETNLYLCESIYKGNNKNFIPNLLNRSEDKGDIIATKNTKRSYHWGVELLEAIENECEIFIIEEIKYEARPVFKEFVDYFYSKRLIEKKLKNDALVAYYKLLLNSLYGKFAQTVKPQKIICNNLYEVQRVINNKKLKIVSFDSLDDNTLVLEYISIDDVRNSIGNLCRFSSFITASARSNLSKFMRNVGHDNVYYCDTDSVFTTKKPDEEFIDDSILGKWKLEDLLKTANFLNPKSYKYEKLKGSLTMKAKGNPTTALKKEFFNGNEHQIVNPNMFIRSLDTVHIIEQARTLRGVYNKRIFNDDDNTSEAYTTYKEWYNNKYGKK